MSLNNRQRRYFQHWLAWIGLCGALAIHVADEALTDFLAWYNPTVLAIRARYPFLPLTTFTFEGWLSLLIFAVVALIAASFFVWHGRWAMRPISYAFAGFMMLNGALHIALSFYLGTFMSGVYSSPLLLAASFALLAGTRAVDRAGSPVKNYPDHAQFR